MIQKFDNLINGQWVAATGYAPNINPSNLADVIGDYAQGDARHSLMLQWLRR